MDSLDKRINATQKIVDDNWMNDYKMTIIQNQLEIMKALKELKEKDWKDKSVFFGNPG